MKFYKRDPDRALCGMAELTLKQRGAYNSLLDLLYSRDGDVDDDDQRVARMISCHWREWAAVKKELIALGKVWVEGGKLRARRVQETIKEASDFAQEQGRRVSKRWHKSEKANEINNPFIPAGNTNTPTPTPTPTKEEKKEDLDLVPTRRAAPSAPADFDAQIDWTDAGKGGSQTESIGHVHRDGLDATPGQAESTGAAPPGYPPTGETGDAHQRPLKQLDAESAPVALLIEMPAAKKQPRPAAKSSGIDEQQFEEWLKQYPRRVGVGAARTAWGKALKKATVQDLMAGVARYRTWCDETGQETQFIAHPATWLNQERWRDDHSSKVVRIKPEPVSDFTRVYGKLKAEGW